MNAACRDFRTLLENRLARRAAPERLADLAWHEHLFTCEGCRALLDAEEALESLLASLPEPHLEPVVRERVLARLRDARDEERLDSLLELAGATNAPSDLSRDVIASVHRRVEDERLDRLLDLDVVEVPHGLATRTSSALRLARHAPSAEPIAQSIAQHVAPSVPQSMVRPITPSAPRRKRTGRPMNPSVQPFAATRTQPIAWRIAGFAAAAAVLVAILWFARGDETTRETAPPAIVDAPPAAVDRLDVGSANAQVSDEMLAALDVLENWDVLVTEDVETLLSTLPEDAAVLLEDLEDEG